LIIKLYIEDDNGMREFWLVIIYIRDNCSFGLWLTPYFSYIAAVSFIDGGNWQTLYNLMLYTVHLACVGFNTTTLMVRGTDCIGSSDHDHDGPRKNL